MELLRSLAFFLAAGLCEIGGGYLVWLWLREGRSPWYALVGAVLLVLYGIVPTFQPAHFSRVYGGLRRRVRRALAALGLASRQYPTRPSRPDWSPARAARRGRDDVLAACGVAYASPERPGALLAGASSSRRFPCPGATLKLSPFP
jgi:drug/metabolite transporter superfamily protein YnfA